MRHSKDILWKGLLEWVFDDFLRFVFPNADDLFDFQKGFGFLDKELTEIHPDAEKKIDLRIVDKLVKVHRKGGGEECLLVHIEVQDRTKAQGRPLFPERMFRYFYRCFDRYRTPVAAIAIFCGPDGNQLSGRYEYACLNTRLRYDYTTLRILDYPDEELRESKNPFAWVLLIAKHALRKGKDLDDKLLEGKLFVFRKLLENDVLGKQKLQAILTFLHNYARFENTETYHVFSNKIKKITNKTNAMSLIELLPKEDVLKANKKYAVKLLLTKTRFSVEKIASIVGLSVTTVRRIRKEVRGK